MQSDNNRRRRDTETIRHMGDTGLRGGRDVGGHALAAVAAPPPPPRIPGGQQAETSTANGRAAATTSCTTYVMVRWGATLGRVASTDQGDHPRVRSCPLPPRRFRCSDAVNTTVGGRVEGGGADGGLSQSARERRRYTTEGDGGKLSTGMEREFRRTSWRGLPGRLREQRGVPQRKRRFEKYRWGAHGTPVELHPPLTRRPRRRCAQTCRRTRGSAAPPR